MNARHRQNVRCLRRPNGTGSPGRRFRANSPAQICADVARMDGTLVDISCGGAKLHVTAIPPGLAQFWLVVERAPPIRAELAWQDADQVGIRFLEEQAWVSQLYKQRFNPAAWLEQG